MIKLYAGIGIAVALVAAVWWYGSNQYNDGREYERAQWMTKLLAKDAAMADLIRRHDDERAKREVEFDRANKRAAARIAGLIAQNAELRAWWEALVPPAAAAYAWGLPDDAGAGGVPPGPVVDPGAPGAGPTGAGP